MSGAFIDIEIDDKQIMNAFNKAVAAGADMRPAMKRIGTLLVNSFRENFVSQGRPDKWKPLSEATLHTLIGGEKGYAKKGYIREGAARKITNKKILIDMGMSGGLMESIHYKAERDNVAVGVGTDKEYGAIHQFGGMAGRGRKVRIPARPYLVVQDGDMEEIKIILSKYLRSLGKAV